MSKAILHHDGAITVMAPGFSAEKERLSLLMLGVSCRVVDLALLHRQHERIFAAKGQVTSRIRSLRDACLARLDIKQGMAATGYHTDQMTVHQVEAQKQVLGELLTTIETRGDLDELLADELNAYLPPELEDS